MAENKPAYTIADKLPIVATPDVKVTLMTYAPGQEVPWHSHTTVTDSTFCLAGDVELAFRDPEEAVLLKPGDFRQVPPGRTHRVRCLGPDPCKVLLVQGVGAYDFKPA
ncbi:cupin domain-containing protein [Fundidesulfovibrio terrae]|uniref:cupin domain-containing protein n=1 Tax=Fundidesulfovibrio terrae TaxID=2922866 RepID=UPI001FAF2329|nr:cupin domain-containing protein [Fundidesulfovibrio terrae]